MKQYQWWWDNVKDENGEFEGWLGGVDSPSRKYVANYVKGKEFKSVLDCACGYCTDRIAFEGMDYQGIDITPFLVDLANSKGLDVIQGNIEHIPLKNGSVDLVYARHILEHLESYEKALFEMVRVAKKEVMVVFFRKPGVNEELGVDQALGGQVYLNRYDLMKLIDYCQSLPGVDRPYMTLDIEGSEDEAVLHIIKKP